MMTWLSMILGNIVVLLILSAVVFAAARTIVSDRKQGKSSCGSHCGSCPMSGSCHNKKGQRQKQQ